MKTWRIRKSRPRKEREVNNVSDFLNIQGRVPGLCVLTPKYVWAVTVRLVTEFEFFDYHCTLFFCIPGTAPRSSDLLRRVQIEVSPKPEGSGSRRVNRRRAMCDVHTAYCKNILGSSFKILWVWREPKLWLAGLLKLIQCSYNSTPSPPFPDTSPRLFRPVTLLSSRPYTTTGRNNSRALSSRLNMARRVRPDLHHLLNDPPIYSVPNELLAEIFLEFLVPGTIFGSAREPFNIMHTSRRFRSVILGSSVQWSSLHMERYHYYPQCNHLEGRCASHKFDWDEILRHYLIYSRNLPLDLQLDFTYLSTYSLRLVLSQRERWQKIVFININDRMSGVGGSDFDLSRSGELKELSLPCNNTMVTNILRTIRPHKLTNLCFYINADSFTSVRNRILAVLRDSPNLVQLSLDLAYETEFPGEDDEEIYDDVPERIALNRLERLKLCHVFCHSLLGCLKAPALQRTYLAVWMLEDVAMLERFFIASKPPLLDFKLNLIDYGDLEWDMDIIAQFQGIFAELSLLESMTIFSESTLVNNIRFWGLLTVRGGNILVPKLHTFSLQLSEDHPDNEYDRGYVVDFAESRWNHMPNFKICLDYESFLGWFEERFGEGSVDAFSASGKVRNHF